MACGCETYQCVEVFVNPCNEGTNTGIVAAQTGNYTFKIGFNSTVSVLSVAGVSGEEINIPTSALNENYTHETVVIAPDGETTCYWMNTIPSYDIADAPYVPGSTEFRLPYTVETTSDTITVEGVDGRTVQAILLPNGTLTRQQFTQVGNSLTYTGNEFYEGDDIVLIF